MDIKDYLIKNCSQLGIEITDIQALQFEKYYNLIIKWNSKINLTRITRPCEVAVKHFADSLTILKYCNIKENAKIIDVGTGAGFPGIPLKIVRPDIRLTLLDSLNKRLVFLSDVCKQLSIEAEIIHSRAEEEGNDPQFREKFDFAVSRAVARLNTLSEYCIPFVKVDGKFVSMKGPDLKEELKDAENAISFLGGKREKIIEFSLPDDIQRTIAVIRKIKATPKGYPRHGSKIKSKPL